MAKKIATAAAVFRACNELDAGGQSWNRDDVRLRVGGGGFNIIDPLIQAWRRLKPLKSIAPNTPTELLHQVTESLEQHLSTFVEKAEKNVTDSQAVFEQTTSELAETIDNLNNQISEITEAHQELKSQHKALLHKYQELEEDLRKSQNSEERLQTGNDGLRGQIQRIKSEFETAKDEDQKAMMELKRQHQEAIAARDKQHQDRLQSEKSEWQNTHQLSEDRLLRLLDKERQQSKELLVSLEKANADLKASEAITKEKLSTAEMLLVQKDCEFTQLQSDFDNTQKTLDQLKDKHRTLSADYESLAANTSQQDKLAQLEQAITTLQSKLSK